jgi:hypothetical protein
MLLVPAGAAMIVLRLSPVPLDGKMLCTFILYLRRGDYTAPTHALHSPDLLSRRLRGSRRRQCRLRLVEHIPVIPADGAGQGVRGRDAVAKPRVAFVNSNKASSIGSTIGACNID